MKLEEIQIRVSEVINGELVGTLVTVGPNMLNDPELVDFIQSVWNRRKAKRIEDAL